MGSIRDKYKGFKYISGVFGFGLFIVFLVVAFVLLIISFFNNAFSRIFDNYSYYGLITIIFLSVALFYYLVSIYNFICPHCLRVVYLRKINDITCPFCKEGGKNYKTLFNKCSCGGVIQFYECPHCHKPIDLFAEYSRYDLTLKRYKKG